MNAKLVLPVLMLAIAGPANAKTDSTKAVDANRKPSSNAKMNEYCERAARATIAAATSADGNDEPSEVAKSVVFTSVKVTARGEIPPADGVTDLGYKASFKSESMAESGIVRLSVHRGGCLVEEMILDK